MSEDKKIQSVVYCKVDFEGIHCWPQCPFEEVRYLRDPHRHIFKITAYKEVNHDDRDVEFIMLKHQIEKFLEREYPGGILGAMSCEMLGRQLLEEFNLMQIDVSEDGENGAVMYRSK